MRRKVLFLLLGLTIFFATSVFAQSGSSSKGKEGEVGRYQLFQGTYTSFDLKRQQTATHPGIFLIDTKTGEAKRYLNKIDEQGNYIEIWMPTETQK
jgi:hypothetical protein